MVKSRDLKKLASLDELASLRSQLASEREEQKRRAQAEKEAKEAAEAERKKLEQEANLFQTYVQNVQPLKKQDRRIPEVPKPEPLPRFSKGTLKPLQPDNLSDDWDVQHILELNEDLSYRKNGVSKEALKKLRNGLWVVQAQVDLHGHRTDEARIAINEFIHACAESDLRCVRVIHGKGLGSRDDGPVLKEKAKRWLLQKKQVLAFCQAPPKDGGDGALLVLLKGKRQQPSQKQKGRTN